MNAEKAPVADLARLNFLLGELYAEAVLAAQKKFAVTAELIGCHGQTLYHQGEAQPYLGRRLAVTWQSGEGAVLAARTGIAVVSDFRPADMAAGGKGAPLVPFLDYTLYSDRKVGRIVQNIGGIANLSAMAAGVGPDKIIAFDTGPGNMVIDAVVDHLYKKAFDKNGTIAASGKVLDKALAPVLGQAFFSRRPPKTAGREEFGREFVGDFLRRCRGARKEDSYQEVVVSGGGAKNPTLMRMLIGELSRLELHVRTSDEFGLPAEAKEAVAFALLAFQTWHRRASNLPSATGAKRPAILGKVSYV
jgi:anhydro-N-acetylmuramic acid kinase